jgi:hypothetical protein
MSLEAEPIARRGGGWISPGLTSPSLEPTDYIPRSRGTSPMPSRILSSEQTTWASAKASSARVRRGASPGDNILTRWIPAPFSRFMRHTDRIRPEHGAEKEKLEHRRSTAVTGAIDLGNFQWEDVARRCRSYFLYTNRWKAGMMLVLLLFWWFATIRKFSPPSPASGSIWITG